jgi:hypothetical protein
MQIRKWKYCYRFKKDMKKWTHSFLSLQRADVLRPTNLKDFFFAANIISSGCDYYENSSMIWTKIIDYEKEMLKLVNLHYSKINKNKCVSYVSIFLGKVLKKLWRFLKFNFFFRSKFNFEFFCLHSKFVDKNSYQMLK